MAMLSSIMATPTAMPAVAIRTIGREIRVLSSARRIRLAMKEAMRKGIRDIHVVWRKSNE